MQLPKIQTLLYQAVLNCFFLTMIVSNSWGLGTMLNHDQLLSPNVPLDSPVYLYLDKLDGLGYLTELRPDTKPYTRRQAARWVKLISENVAGKNIPVYAQRMLKTLRTEFAAELAKFKTVRDSINCRLSGLNWSNTYYDGAALRQAHTKSTYQPLNVNQNGYQLREGWNSALTVRLESEWEDFLVLSATPRLSYDEVNDGSVSFESGYLKMSFGNLEVQLGKDAMWWGPGLWGTLPLSNNASPLKVIKLSNLEPIRLGGALRFLKQMDGTFFCSERDDDRGDVPGASTVGFRATFAPSANFTFGGALTAILGGAGHELHGRDYLKFFTGKNAKTGEADKWDSIAGADFHWRFPRLNGLRVYGELYGEDQTHILKIVPFPYKNANLVGVTLPRLAADGRWDLTLETAHTTKVWYQHSLYSDGYTYGGKLLGEAMGGNATRYDLKLSRYFPDGSMIDFCLERLELSTVSARRINAIWLNWRRELPSDLLFSVTLGLADQTDAGAQNGLLSIGLTKRFNKK
jgi:hypothetical protein